VNIIGKKRAKDSHRGKQDVNAYSRSKGGKNGYSRQKTAILIQERRAREPRIPPKLVNSEQGGEEGVCHVGGGKKE